MSRNELPDVIREFVTAKLADGVTPRAAESYRYHLRRFAAKQSLTTLEDMTPAKIRVYLVAMRDEGLSPYTVYNAGKTIRVFCRWLESEGIASSPWKNIKAPTFPNEAQPPFTKEDVKAILKAALTPRDRALVMLLLDTGLRLKEVTALTTDDLNMETGAVIVRRGKGGKFRTVFMGAKARRAMSAYLRTLDGDGALWRADSGAPLASNGLSQAIGRIGERANVQPCTVHRFRRTFGVFSLRAGMDLRTLQELLGHARLVLLDRYTRFVTEDLQRAHDAHGALDQMLK